MIILHKNIPNRSKRKKC